MSTYLAVRCVILASCAAGLLAGGAAAQQVRVVRYADSEPFRMGAMTSRRIVHPDMGAKNTTLNLSISTAGAEFAQHQHDRSDDTILVLEGQVNLRQGESLRPFKAGEFAFIPAGQTHGTITTGAGETVMISFQNPPDIALYTGARDPGKAGPPAALGKITPGAVKYMNFRGKDGRFSGPGNGSMHVTASHWRLVRNKVMRARAQAGGELLLFVWKGGIRVSDGRQTYVAGERDTIFVQGKADLEMTGNADGAIEIIQVEAPGGAGR